MLNYISTLPMWAQLIGYFFILSCVTAFIVALIYVVVYKLNKVKIETKLGEIEADLGEEEKPEAVTQ